MSTLERPQRASAAEAEARINAYSPDSPLPLEDPGEGEPVGELRVCKSKALRNLVKARLLESIESAIGRDIVLRNRRPIDPCQDDLEPPKLYKWTFTPQYPSFPTGPRGNWTFAMNKACLYALDQGWLSVLALPTQAVNGLPILHGREDVDGGSDDQSRLSSANDGILEGTSEQCTIDHSIRLIKEQIEAGDDISRIWESCSKADDLILKMEAVHREADKLLETHRKHLLEIRENVVESAIPKTKLLEDAAKGQILRHERLKTRFEELQKEYSQISEENLALKNELEHHLHDLEQERRLGEIEELRTENQYLRNDRDTQFEHHMIQSREAKKDGIRKGEANAHSHYAALIADLKRQLGDLKGELEKNQANHASEVSRAREESRREEEVLSQLLEGHNLFFKGRKRQEIRTIYNNWKNIPRNILPKLMLPDDVLLGDSTLILLARLSRVEHDPHKATALLQKVVDLRNYQLAVTRKEPMVTNADIEKVLSNLGVVESGQRNSEISSTSQAESSQDIRGVRNLSPCRIHHRQAGSGTHGIEEISRATPPSHEDENDSSTHVADLKKSSISHQRLSKSLHRRRTTEMKTNIIVENFSQDSALEKQQQMAVDQKDALSTTNHSIEEEINILGVPCTSLTISSLQHFPMEFVKDSIGGNNSTFSKCSRKMLDKQIVTWPETIKWNPVYHPLCPTQDRNGALTFVDGRPNIGEIGKTYPILLREKVNFYKYIGHYKVLKRIIMPVAVWKSCTLEERLGIAEEIEAKEWGRTLLRQKGLFINATDVGDKRLDDILEFFEKPQEPCLRMSWALLQFTTFKLDDYDLLLYALREWEMGEDVEDDVEDDASSVGPKLSSRFLNSQSSSQDTKGNKQFLDELPSAAAAVTRNDAERTSRRTVESNEALRRHREAGVSGAAKSDLPAVSEIHISGQVTSSSFIYISDGCESPEYLAQAEDGRRRTHASKDSRVHPTAGSVAELQSPGTDMPSLNLKRPYEEDLYGVSPTRHVPGESSKTRSSIFSSFAKPKKRKSNPFAEYDEDDSS